MKATEGPGTAGTSRAAPVERAVRVIREQAAYVGYLGAARLAATLPGWLVLPTAVLTGRCAMALMARRRHLVTRHLRRVVGADLAGRPLRRLVASVFVSYARYWLETFRLPSQEAAAIVAAVEADGIEFLDAARHADRGAILASAHFGGFDVGGAWLAATGRPPTTVVERVRPARLFDWFVAKRRSLGIEVVAHEPGAFDELRRVLAAGGIVALVCDRDLGRRGVDVEFFGEHTTLPAGPARLALETGAPLLPVAVYCEGHRHRAVIRPPIQVQVTGCERDDVARVTQQLAWELEALIRVAPEQWHLMVPNWPSDPRPAAGCH